MKISLYFRGFPLWVKELKAFHPTSRAYCNLIHYGTPEWWTKTGEKNVSIFRKAWL